jgi:hypothetical protein
VARHEQAKRAIGTALATVLVARQNAHGHERVGDEGRAEELKESGLT